MKKKEIMDKLNRIFAEVFDDSNIEITEMTTAKDIYEWDSLMHLQLIASVEQAFAIRFTLGEINNFANVGEMAACIESHMGD